MVDRYQSINPEKDGATVRGIADLKNEVKIITLPNDLFALWEKFLTMHQDGRLIDPVTCEPFNTHKGYKPVPLKREFFRHGGHFTDTDYGVWAQHLLGETPRRLAAYPKVSVSKTRILVEDNMASYEWAERRKRKKVILQDLMALKTNLKFLDRDGDVIDETWRSWKARHRFSSATWDFLLSHPKSDYFKKRLTNEGWTKRVTQLAKQHPEVLYMYQQFLKLKYNLPKAKGKLNFRGMNLIANSLVTSTDYMYVSRNVNLAVVDTQMIPKPQETKERAAVDPFLQFLAEKLEPKMDEPNVWLFILTEEDLKAVKKFAPVSMAGYQWLESSYVPAKAEMLDNVTNRGHAPDVPLLFLLKKDNDFAKAVRKCVKEEYTTPVTSLYYKEVHRNSEAKWRIDAKELRMEFYFKILRDFLTLEESVLGICTGPKFMLASKVGHILDSLLSSSR